MLITLAEIRQRRQISTSVKQGLVNQYIEDAEFEDLRPLMGERLYQDVVDNPGQTTAGDYTGNYVKLLTGGTYVFSTYTYSHPGIKAVLIDFFYARYRFFGNDIDTPFGSVQKHFNEGINTNPDRNREVYGALRKSAFAKWASVKNYLLRVNGTDDQYELFDCPIEPLDDSQDSITINRVTLR